MRVDRGHFFSALAGLIAGALLIGALPALGANGDIMYVGQKNNALRATKLISRDGLLLQVGKAGNPALTIDVVGDTPPMQVNSTGLVDNLNADLLDGMEAAAFSLDGHDHDADYVNETDHTKAAHDALDIDADTLDGVDSTAVSTMTSPMVIPATEFQSTHNAVDAYFYPDGGCWVCLSGATGAYFMAPVRLPQGATLTDLIMRYYDNSAPFGAAIYLWRKPLNSLTDSDDIAYAWGTGESTALQTVHDDTFPGAEVVDNTTYQYFILVYLDCGGIDVRFYEAVIEFTSP